MANSVLCRPIVDLIRSNQGLVSDGSGNSPACESLPDSIPNYVAVVSRDTFLALLAICSEAHHKFTLSRRLRARI
jgi:hypothetical protein